jgi:hypothetical protein
VIDINKPGTRKEELLIPQASGRFKSDLDPRKVSDNAFEGTRSIDLVVSADCDWDDAVLVDDEDEDDTVFQIDRNGIQRFRFPL